MSKVRYIGYVFFRLRCHMAVVLLSLMTAMPLCGAVHDVDSVLSVLDAEIECAAEYQAAKKKKIGALRDELDRAGNDAVRFAIYDDLNREYKYYQYDSAYSYARRMLDTAILLGDSAKTAMARIALIDCYTAVGFFKEATDMVDVVKEEEIPADRLPYYYALCSKLYQNMESYVGGQGTELGRIYAIKRREYLDKGLASSRQNTREYASVVLDLMDINGENSADGRLKMLERYDVDDHDKAINYSITGFARLNRGQIDEAIYYMALSAIHDIKSCTHETTAMQWLARLMHDKGDYSRANKYIHLALDDAYFYNSRLRQNEINVVLPKIETARFNRVSGQLWFLVVAITVVLALLVAVMVLLFKLRRRNRSLAESHKVIALKSGQLEESNRSLTVLNEKLKETNEIKDRYIIQSLYGNSTFINEVEEKCKIALRKLKARQYDDIDALLYEIGIKKERERMFSSFDSAFLKLFPNFIDEFNRLFPEESRIVVDDAGELPTEIRIYALMRLGIDNPSQVAKYLNLSVNTVYVYKTKLKSRAAVDKNDFDRLVMNIPKP